MDYTRSQPLEKVALALNRSQIDYEIVPEDVLCTCPAENGTFQVGQETLKALIISGRAYVTQRVEAWCEEAAAAGVPIFYIDQLPAVVSN